MDEIKKDDIVKYITVDPGSVSSKYKNQFGFVNSVGPENFFGKVLYSVKFIDKKIVYGIPEDCIRKATDKEELIFLMEYASKCASDNLLNSWKSVAEFDKYCRYNAKTLKEENNMYNIGDVIKYQFSGNIKSEDAEKKFRHHMECAKIVNYNHVTCLYTIKFADLEQVEVSSHGFIPATPGEICRFNMKFDKAKAFSPKWEIDATVPMDSTFISTCGPVRDSLIKDFNLEENMFDINRFKVGDCIITVNSVWIIPCNVKGKVLAIDINKGIYVEFKNGIKSPCGLIKTRWMNPLDIRKISLEEYDLRMVKKSKEEEIKNMNKNMIKKVIFSGDRTVVIWNDGDKTIVKASNEAFDKEKGLAMAIAKKALGTNKNKSNYYDVFKKWIPEEEEKKEEPKEFPMNKPEEHEEEGKPWDPSMRHQSFKKKTREQISEEIVDKIMMGADTEDIKKSIEESKKIIEHEKVKAAAPKVTSYKPSEPSEMGVISDFVKTFKPTYFFKDFLEFCKNNGLAFITNDGEVMNPFEVSLPKLNWLGKQKRITTITKHKVYPGANNTGKDVMAVDINETLFQRLPREYRTKGQKED